MNSFLKTIFVLLLTALVLLAFAIRSWCVTYYVSNSYGSDSNSGTSVGNAWQTIGKVNAATFSAGDSILFYRGDTWAGVELNTPSAGTSGNPVYFGNYGCGSTKPRIDRGGNRGVLIDVNWIVFDGIAVSDGDGTGDTHAGIYVSGTNVTIKNCLVDSNYYGIRFREGGSGTVLNSVSTENDRGGITINSNAGAVTIDGCTVYRNGKISGQSRNGIGADNTAGLVIRNSTIYSNGLDPADAGFSHGIYMVQGGDNGTIENNVIYDQPNGHGIACQWNNANIRYNEIRNNDRFGVLMSGTTGAVSGDTIRIQYNVIIGGSSQRGGVFVLDFGWDADQNVKVENNVIYRNDNTSGTYQGQIIVREDVNSLFIRNNILETNVGQQIMKFQGSGTTQSNMTSDYNDLYKADGGTGYVWYNGASRTFSAWQGLGFDGNSVSGNPMLVSPTTNWRLQSGSPCRNAGTDVGLTEDFYGSTVPQGSAVDIGAAEFNETPEPPTTEVSYPRIAAQHFGEHAPDWYALFDLAIVAWDSTSLVEAIKAANPNTVVLRTYSWTSHVDDDIQGYMPTLWKAVDSAGDTIALSSGWLLDMSGLSPSHGTYGRYQVTHPETLFANVPVPPYDGHGSDWIWEKPSGISDIDLDRNGQNDYTQHSTAWVDSTWQVGVEEMVSNMRTKIGADPPLWLNSGKLHDWQFANHNGMEFERKFGFTSWSNFWSHYQGVMDSMRTPHTHVIDFRPNSSDPNAPAQTKNYFRLMRFGLAATLLGDGYFEFNPEESGEHHHYGYYDEYDVPLGFPTSDAIELTGVASDVYVRFFDSGAVIVNVSGSTQTVADADISGQAGYNGPYRRFQGGQDTAFNDSSAFGSVSLWGGSYSGNTQGDGILLVKTGQRVIADIYIDDEPLNTSPGSDSMTVSGSWTYTGAATKFWAGDVQPNAKAWYACAYATNTGGTKTATFTPTFGVDGNYEVFVWYGQVTGETQATDAPYTVYYNGAASNTTVDVNQQINQGQLNSIGTYQFNDSGNERVELGNSADGTVVADMVLFRYMGN